MTEDVSIAFLLNSSPRKPELISEEGCYKPEKFNVSDLLTIMNRLYPTVDEDRDDDYEHPMIAVGVVLLSAAMLGITEEEHLVQFTGYSRDFISAIKTNMVNNRFWTGNHYSSSEWFLANDRIDAKRFWDHIDFACGEVWAPEAGTSFSEDSCMVYWRWRERVSGEYIM